MKLVTSLLTLAVILSILGGGVFAQDTEKDLEDAIKKLDEYYKKLRAELERKLAKKKHVKPVPAEGSKPVLGVSLSPLSKGVRVLLNLEEGEGVVVKRVVEGSPADKAGIRAYDILLKFNGRRVGSLEDVKEILSTLSGGDEVKVLTLRDGKRRKATLVLGAGGTVEPGRTKPDRTEPGTPRGEIERFLNETLRGRHGIIRKYVKDLLGDNLEKRLRARRFFEKLATQSRDKRRKIIREIQKVVGEMLGGLSQHDKEQLEKIFHELMGGLRESFERVEKKRTQKKEDIEAFLEKMLGGKVPTKKTGKKKDDIDKLIEELLGDKKKTGPKKEPGKEPKKGEFEIPKEWEDMLKGILGKEGFARLKEMMKDPAMREMIKNFLPKDFKFTPDAIRKLMRQYGVTEEELPDRLREMGLEEESIKKILEMLKKKDPVKKSGRPWIGISASEIDEDQKTRLGVAGGLVVTKIRAEGPGDKAGLLEDDIILKFNDRKVHNTGDLKEALKGLHPGDTVTLQILRDGYKKLVKMTLSEKK